MATDRRKQMVAGGLCVVLAAVTYRAWVVTSVAPGTTPARRAAASAAAAQPEHSVPPTPDVHLESLNTERPKPVAGDRNLFRFKARGAAPESIRPVTAPSPMPVPGQVFQGPPPAPPLPPIMLRFIGIVEAADQPQKIAVLSDGRNVFYGREGDAIEGRFRIVRIGAESIEMAYLDGRGRQTIRLTGG